MMWKRLQKSLPLILCVLILMLGINEYTHAAFGGGGAFGGVINYLKKVNTYIRPAADNTYDLGSASRSWKDFHADGVVYVGTIESGNITMDDAAWIGLGAAKGRAIFNDAATDNIVIEDANVGIGGVPGRLFEVHGAGEMDDVVLSNATPTANFEDETASEDDWRIRANADVLVVSQNVNDGAWTDRFRFEADGSVSIVGSNNELRWYEGVNYIGYEAPALAADLIWVLQDIDGNANEASATDGAGTKIWRTHDELAAYDANDHIDHTTVSMTAGVGISGGGTIAATRDFALDGTEIDAVSWSDSANASNVWTHTSSGTDTTVTYGDGVITFGQVTAGEDPILHEHYATKQYVDQVAAGASKDFFISDTASGVGANYVMYPADTGDAQSTLTSAGETSGDDQLIFGWLTEANEPGIVIAREGVYELHSHMNKGTGDPTTVYYWTLTKVDADGSSNLSLMMTSELSGELTNSSVSYNTHAVLGTSVALDATSRYLLQIYVNVTGGGTSETTVTMEGVHNSNLNIRVPSEVFQTQGDVLDDLNTTGTVGANGEFLLGTAAGAMSWENPAAALVHLSGQAGAAFSLNEQDFTNVGDIGCDEITLVDGYSINLQEAITYTGATTENLIEIPDNLADAISLKNANGDVFIKVVSTTGSLGVEFPQVVTVADESVTATNAAPTTDTMLVNKKYVDDQVGGVPVGDVTAAAVIADHTIVRGDGGAKGVQDSGWTISDADLMSAGGPLAVDTVTDNGAGGVTIEGITITDRTITPVAPTTAGGFFGVSFQTGGWTAGGECDMGSAGKIVNMNDPTANQDAATKKYVDDTAVLDSLFNAHTVLQATADNTPLALTVTEQTVVGRLTGGNIAAVAMGIADNNMVQVDGTPVDTEVAIWTATGLDSNSEAEFTAAFNLEAADFVAAVNAAGLTLADAKSISLQEDITWTGATTENLIKIPDNLAVALDVTEAGNSYLRFITQNGSELVQMGKNTVPTAGSGQTLGNSTLRWDLHTEQIIFGGATGGNLLKIPDNFAEALVIEEDTNDYITFVTTNGSEAITLHKITTIADGSLTATAGAPTTDAMIANKKYVDDTVGGGAAHQVLDGDVHTDSIDQDPSRGSLILGNSAATEWDELVTSAGFLGSDGVDTFWSTELAHEYGGLEADVNAYDGLVKISAGATSAVTITAFGASIIDDADEATFKATVNLEIGTDVLAEQTIGIADDNLVEVDGTPVNGEVAIWTANGLDSNSEAEFKTAFNMEASVDFVAWVAGVRDMVPASSGVHFADGAANNCDSIVTYDSTDLEQYNQVTAQDDDQDLDVVYQILVPLDFSTWDTNNALDITYKVSDAVNSGVTVAVYDTAGALDFTSARGQSATEALISITAANLDGTYTDGGTIVVIVKADGDTADIISIGKVVVNYNKE